LLTPVNQSPFFFSYIYLQILPLTPIQASLALFAFACVPEQDLMMTDLKQNSDSLGRGNSFARCDAEFFVVWCLGFKIQMCCRRIPYAL
jgi:hypothetical protein